MVKEENIYLDTLKLDKVLVQDIYLDEKILDNSEYLITVSG